MKHFTGTDTTGIWMAGLLGQIVVLIVGSYSIYHNITNHVIVTVTLCIVVRYCHIPHCYADFHYHGSHWYSGLYHLSCHSEPHYLGSLLSQWPSPSWFPVVKATLTIMVPCCHSALCYHGSLLSQGPSPSWVPVVTATLTIMVPCCHSDPCHHGSLLSQCPLPSWFPVVTPTLAIMVPCCHSALAIMVPCCYSDPCHYGSSLSQWPSTMSCWYQNYIILC